MVLSALIDKVNTEKPNTFTEEQLIAFVNEVEAEVAEQLGKYSVTEYTTDDTTVELLAPAPYDRLYVSYLKAMIDYTLEEYNSYQNNQTQHVQDFRDYVDWVVRTDQKLSDNKPKRFRNVI